jgi:hypothetical protein
LLVFGFIFLDCLINIHIQIVCLCWYNAPFIVKAYSLGKT